MTMSRVNSVQTSFCFGKMNHFASVILILTGVIVVLRLTLAVPLLGAIRHTSDQYSLTLRFRHRETLGLPLLVKYTALSTHGGYCRTKRGE